MSTAAISGSSVVTLMPLHLGAEQAGEHEVGRPDTGVFIALPPEGVALLRWLQEGTDLDGATRRFEATYGVAPDLTEFVDDLISCGFVAAIDGDPVDGADQPRTEAALRGVRLLAGLPTGAVRWLVHPATAVVSALVAVAVLALLALRPDVRPQALDGFLDLGPLPNLLVLTALGWGLAFLHELAHLATVRARGCSASLDISHRLHFLVAQTDMSSVRTLPRRERYAPYLAGLCWDSTVLLVLLVLDAAGLGSDVSRAAAYLLVMAIVFELGVFMRTDLYYVLTNALRLGNLAADARHVFANAGLRLVGRPPAYDLTDIPLRERRFIGWYSAVSAVAIAIVLGQFVFLGLPLLGAFLAATSQGLHHGVGTTAFWSSVGILAVVGLQFGLLGVAVIRERRRRGLHR